MRFAVALMLIGCERSPSPVAPPAKPTPVTATSSASPPTSVPAPLASAAPMPSAAIPPSTPGPRTIDRAALERLVEDARASDSDELVVLQDGKLIGDFTFTPSREPIQLMSITKSILSLAVGTLIDQKKLRLDQPVADFYPEWRNGPKSAITLLHLLSHTSGLDEGKTSKEIYAHRSFVEFSLHSKLVYPPGTHYEYSNRGANLVSGIIGKASGMRTDRYVAKALLNPLGIRRFHWDLDRAGQPQGLAGLHLLPRDLAKIGQLVLDDGVFEGKRVVSEEWITHATREPSEVQPTNKRKALFFWLVPEWTRVTIDEQIVAGWRAAGADSAFVAKTAPLVGRQFTSVGRFVTALRELFGDPRLDEWNDNTWKRDVPDARFEFGPIVGTYSGGTLGQYVVVLPRDRIIAVRMRRAPKNPSDREDTTKTFPDFVERVQALVK